MTKILCVDDDAAFLMEMKLKLADRYEILCASALETAIEAAKKSCVDIVFLDIGLDGENGIDGIGEILSSCPCVDVVMLSGKRDPRLVVRSLRAGAADYITKPVDADEIHSVVAKLMGQRKVRERYEALIEDQNMPQSNSNIVFCSEAIRKVLSQAEQLKGHNANVLIVGETGTGKELIARFIHRQERELRRPFIAVNCAAIPENLIEAELFGCEAGAFTGAVRRRIGKFELADGGDIFLDEIGALRLDLQAKILRVLQEKEFQRLGGNETIKTDFRVIAATNEGIDERVNRGEFRMDLYHRIRVIQLEVAPLRSRTEDIPLLVDHFLSKFSNGGVRKRMSPQSMERLLSYRWPGNVRELGNVVQSLAILSPTDVILESAFPPWAMNGCGVKAESSAMIIPQTDQIGALSEYVSVAEKHYIRSALRRCRGDKSKTARLLQIGRTTLYAKLKELELSCDDFSLVADQGGRSL